MKFLCTRGLLYFSLSLLVVAAAACTQSRPVVPTPTLIPLANETIAPPVEGQPTPIVVEGVTPAPGEATLVPPPGGATAAPVEGGNGQAPTPILLEPTLLPTPTTVGDTGQPVATPEPGTSGGQQPGASGTCSNPYTVQPGEWFYAIARKCGVTPQALLAANPGMNPNVLRPGQTLNMPGGTSGGNGGGAPPPTAETGGQPPTSGGGACPNPYVVQSGDTLFSIAQRCGTTVAAIQQANGIPAPEYIFPGQQLRIP